MHALEGHDYSHIAATLKIPSGTVGTRLLRARKKLRELLLAESRRSEP
jgi:RNA polymerase sigma-70 factor (ECF subfamily)